MKIEYDNLYTHCVLTTYERKCIIPEKNRVRIEKYITVMRQLKGDSEIYRL